MKTPTSKQISAVMSALGKRAAGKKKKFSKAEIKRRTERLEKYSKHNFANGEISIKLNAKTNLFLTDKKDIEALKNGYYNKKTCDRIFKPQINNKGTGNE